MDSVDVEDQPLYTETSTFREDEGKSNIEFDSIEAISSSEDTAGELESAAELLTRVELDLACSSEKLVNLGILVIHVGSRENDFEAFGSDDGSDEGNRPESTARAERALEFDLLYGVLESEIGEQESCLSDLQREIDSSREFVSSFKRPGYDLRELDEKLENCLNFLKISFEQASDLRTQCVGFQRILSPGDEKWTDENKPSSLENGSSSDINVKIKMQTAEEQRQILRMLEKSLARELDLEKKLFESRQTEEELKLRLQQEVYCMEEEAEEMSERLFETKNSAEILSGVSKELLGRLPMAQVKEKDCALEGSKRSWDELFEKVHSVGSSSDIIKKIKMQTAEQQREILRMVDKSFARDLDHEKKLSESRQTAEQLKLHLQQEFYCMEEEAEEMWERLFEAENSAEILSGVSKELLGRLQMAQVCFDGVIHREEDLRSKLQDLTEQVKEKDCALEGSKRSWAELLEKVHSLERNQMESESKLHDMKEKSKDLEVKSTEAEKRAGITEAECKSLKESNMELEKDLTGLKNCVFDETKRGEQLKKQLEDSEQKGLLAEASAVANQEKQNMMEHEIKDMEDLIQDLKSKFSKAKNQTEIAEEKCIMLSESKSELVEEIVFLRRKMEHLETCLLESDEAKKETAKDIRVRTKMIMDLVIQLALERERLRKQILSLPKEKKVAVKYLQQHLREPTVTVIESHDAKVKGFTRSNKNGTSREKSDEGVMGSSATTDLVGNEHGTPSTPELVTSLADATSELYTVRNIDARQLKFKPLLAKLVLIMAIPAFAAFLFRQV